MNPLAYVPDKVKSRLIDKGLSKLAEVAERNGSPKLANALRDLRSDTPFIEDLSAALSRAMVSFEWKWRARDALLTEIIMTETELWRSTDFLGLLAGSLLQPTDGVGSDLWEMRNALAMVVAGRVPEDRVTAGLEALVAAVREEMFAHPKLYEVHTLYLQKAMLAGQVAMIEKLSDIQRDLASIERASQSGLTGASAPLSLPAAPPRKQRGPEADGPPTPAAADEIVPTVHTVHLVTRPSVPHLPDVLTPVFDGRCPIVSSYAPVVGEEAARWLGDIQMRVTDTIEQANFAAQQRIAKDLLAEDLGIIELRASAYYLLGEATRLQADFCDDGAREQLLDAATDAYGAAVDLNGSIRALRGLGRVREVRGDIAGALRLYGRARAGALLAYTDGGDAPDSEAAHEVLRATRHYVACASQASLASPTGLPVPHSKLTQFHGAIAESCDLHYTILPGFSASTRWMQIEWFMGLVLLARAYTVVGNHHQSWLCLAHALDARIGMMDPAQPSLSAIERGNLLWWLRCARAVKAPVPDFDAQLDLLDAAVESGDTSTAWVTMCDIVWPIRPPWLIQRKGT